MAIRPDGLTYYHTPSILNHMKTTLNIHDSVMKQLKQEAARRQCTMSELMETAIRALLHRKPEPEPMPPLLVFDGGGTRVNVADRDALYHAMEGR